MFLMGEGHFPTSGALWVMVWYGGPRSRLSCDPYTGKPSRGRIHLFPMPGLALNLHISNQFPEFSGDYCLFCVNDHNRGGVESFSLYSANLEAA